MFTHSCTCGMLFVCTVIELCLSFGSFKYLRRVHTHLLFVSVLVPLVPSDSSLFSWFASLISILFASEEQDFCTVILSCQSTVQHFVFPSLLMYIQNFIFYFSDFPPILHFSYWEKPDICPLRIKKNLCCRPTYNKKRYLTGWSKKYLKICFLCLSSEHEK